MLRVPFRTLFGVAMDFVSCNADAAGTQRAGPAGRGSATFASERLPPQRARRPRYVRTSVVIYARLEASS